VSEVQSGAKFKSVRRIFRIMDLVSRRGEDLTAKQITHELGTSLSSCYYLLNILTDEGYIEKVPHHGGYRIGPTISMLRNDSRSDFDSKIEPVVEELAQRTRRRAYSAVLSGGEMEVTQVKAPPKSPPVGVVEGFRGASHALALGKVLLAGKGSKYVEGYIDDHGGLEAFTPRTIVQPTLLHSQLNKVRMVGLATDFEEFAQNLCCMAAPVQSKRGKMEGAIGLSTTARRINEEGRNLIEMVQWAAEEASALLEEAP
jgi:acetyl-CoA synthetase